MSISGPSWITAQAGQPGHDSAPDLDAGSDAVPGLMAGVRRSSHRLADGRELIYFDDAGPEDDTPRRVVHDTRALRPARHECEVRRDPLTGDWIAIAADRNDRTYLPPAQECPLCPTAPGGWPSEVPTPDYDVVVFENRFPSLSLRAPEVPATVDGDPLWPRRPGTGRCEVVCFTSDHGSSFASLSPQRARTVIEAWADRTRELSGFDGIEQVVCFENRGQEIGVTLPHPHGQVYGYPYLTPRTDALVRRCREHAAAGAELDLVGTVLAAEQASGRRIVAESRSWTAFVPAAARWPVEVHLVPHRAVPDLAALDGTEREELSYLYLDLLRRLDRYFPGVPSLPYIAAWHQAPVHVDRSLVRLHLQVFSVLRAPGKLKYLAGSESAMAAWVSDVRPEAIAARLREVG